MRGVNSKDLTPPVHIHSAQPLRQTLIGFAASVAVIVTLMAACSRPLTVVAAQPVPELTRQSEVIQRELNARGEEELRVRVMNVTHRMRQAATKVEAEEAAVIEAEVDAINSLLSSLALPPLAPALRFDRGAGRLVW